MEYQNKKGGKRELGKCHCKVDPHDLGTIPTGLFNGDIDIIEEGEKQIQRSDPVVVQSDFHKLGGSVCQTQNRPSPQDKPCHQDKGSGSGHKKGGIYGGF